MNSAARPSTTSTCTCSQASTCTKAWRERWRGVRAGGSNEASTALRGRRARVDDDHARRIPDRAEAPEGIVERAVERVVVVRAGRVQGTLGPQVHHVRIHARIGVVVIAHLAGLAAVHRAGHGDVAALRVDLRIVETLLAGDETAAALFPALRARLRIQRLVQHEEAGLAFLGLGLDDAATPAYARALCGGDRIVRSHRGIRAREFLRNRRAGTEAQGENGGKDQSA